MPVVTDFTAIMTPSSWNGGNETGRPTILTYSFNTSAPAYVTGTYSAAFAASLVPFTSEEQAMTRTALSAWADASGIIFIEAPSGLGDIQFGKYDFQYSPHFAGAFAHYPGVTWNSFYIEDGLGGDIFVNKFDGVQFHEIIHEIGHAIGLKHPFEGDVTLDPSMNDAAFTVMSYNGTNVTGLGTLDVQAVQLKYGVNAQDGAQVQSWSWDALAVRLTQIGGSGADRIRGVYSRDIIEGRGGNDDLAGSFGNDLIDGGDGDDLIFGGGDNDTILGGAGADTIKGGLGDDVMEGGAGDDFIDGADGSDAASYSNAPGAVRINLGEILGVPINTISAGMDTLFVENVIGSEFNDTLYGSTDANSLNGAGGNDLIFAGNGDDFAFGGAGDDVLVGEDGNDSLGGWDGFDWIEGRVGNDWLSAGLGNDRLEGGSGSDTLDGQGGIDAMFGGLGDDVYYVDDFYDDVFESFGQGTDWVFASVNWGIRANVENLYLVGNDPINAFGDAANNVLVGNDANNLMGGYAGLDWIEGKGGDDWLSGGNDDDRLDGGAGSDALDGQAGADTLFGGAGQDFFFYGLASDSSPASFDSIRDFQVGLDKINLSAVRTGPGDTWRTVGAYGNSYLFVDFGGNGSDDMLIELVGVASITQTDLIW